MSQRSVRSEGEGVTRAAHAATVVVVVVVDAIVIDYADSRANEEEKLRFSRTLHQRS
jgi:hypothetical protein